MDGSRSLDLREDLPELPPRMRSLPVFRGYPVPWFVTWMEGGEECAVGEGEPEFRVITAARVKRAVEGKRCWVCGDRLGRYLSFVAGPMCGVNRISAEPPSHLDCARFSAIACPFLTRPHMVRRDNNMPEDGSMPGGKAILRNPGVAMVWTTRSFRPFRQGDDVLFRMGEPVGVEWYAEGVPATRAQIFESIESGMPVLNEGEEEEVAFNNMAAAERLKAMIEADTSVS